MAGYRAIDAVCEGVIKLLATSRRPAEVGDNLQFKVYAPGDFAQPMASGVSLFLYRVFVDGNHRAPPGRVTPDGRRYRHQLPLNLHFLLTAWGQTAGQQHRIAGWTLRVLEDLPILPAALLNSVAGEVFRPEETVEVGLAELKTEDLLRIWETTIQSRYQLSVPYLARAVRIESEELEAAPPAVEERAPDAGRIDG